MWLGPGGTRAVQGLEVFPPDAFLCNFLGRIQSSELFPARPSAVGCKYFRPHSDAGPGLWLYSLYAGNTGVFLRANLVQLPAPGPGRGFSGASRLGQVAGGPGTVHGLCPWPSNLIIKGELNIP